MPQPLRCPVCRAGFRGQSLCSRCGADLTPLMTLVARAFGARQLARRALAGGDLDGARALVDKAQNLCDTPAGRKLARFVADLARMDRALRVGEPDDRVSFQNSAVPQHDPSS